MIKALKKSLILFSLLTVPAFAGGFDFICTATISPVSQDGKLDFVAYKKVMLTELNLNFKMPLKAKDKWIMMKGNNRDAVPANITDTVLGKDFSLEILISGELDGMKSLSANLGHPLAKSAPAPIVQASQKIFSTNSTVEIVGTNETVTVQYAVSCIKSYEHTIIQY